MYNVNSFKNIKKNMYKPFEWCCIFIMCPNILDILHNEGRVDFSSVDFWSL